MARFVRAAVLLIAVAIPLQAELYSRRTNQLNLIYYDKAHEYLSYHLTRCFENSLAFHRALFDYTPSNLSSSSSRTSATTVTPERRPCRGTTSASASSRSTTSTRRCLRTSG